MIQLLKALGVVGLVAVVVLADPASASAQATTSTPDKLSEGAARYLIPKGMITLGANQMTVRIEWTYGKVLAKGDGPNLAGIPPPNIQFPMVGPWTGTAILGEAGQKYWVKAVLTWRVTGGKDQVNLPVRGEVTLDP